MLGTNTRDAVLSGVMNGHALMLEGFITKLKMQYFDLNPMLTILCGGMADLLKPMVPSADIVDKNLTTDGFYMALASLI
nr:type III pantothenate kinase [Candidatus Cloacimonadota bacterium]